MDDGRVGGAFFHRMVSPKTEWHAVVSYRIFHDTNEQKNSFALVFNSSAWRLCRFGRSGAGDSPRRQLLYAKPGEDQEIVDSPSSTIQSRIALSGPVFASWVHREQSGLALKNEYPRLCAHDSSDRGHAGCRRFMVRELGTGT